MWFLMWFLHFLASIPAVIWSGIIASGLTLGGVLLSNRNSMNGLMTKLSHDADEKSKERKATLRREVYLEAVEQLAKTIGFISGITQIDYTKETPDSVLPSLNASFSKIQIVASQDTMKLSSELMIVVTEVYLRALLNASPIHRLNSNIEILNSMYNQHHSERVRISGEIARLIESAQDDEKKYEALSQNLEFNNKQCKMYGDERDVLYEKRNRMHMEFSKIITNEIKKIATLQIPLISSIRTELELETDTQGQLDQLDAHFRRMDANLDFFMGELRNSNKETRPENLSAD